MRTGERHQNDFSKEWYFGKKQSRRAILLTVYAHGFDFFDEVWAIVRKIGDFLSSIADAFKQLSILVRHVMLMR